MKTMSIILLATIISLANVNSQGEKKNSNEYPGLLIREGKSKERMKRGVLWDLFKKVVITKNLVVDQYRDTEDSLNEIYNLISKQFNDLEPTTPTTQATDKITSNAVNNDDNSVVQTTQRPYTISRYELGRILGRNYRGLQRLKDIETNDALNQSHYNLLMYKAEADKQFANSLTLEKKNLIKSFIG